MKDTRYRTIVADPPWAYDEGFIHGALPGWRKRKAVGEPNRDIARSSRKRLPFPTLSVSEIAALPIGDLAEPNAALFLWTTNRYLPDSFRVMEAWGFVYKQILVWNKVGNASPFTGSIAPNTAEFLLVGKRGKHSWTQRASSSVLSISRTRHSKKPEAFLDLIEASSPGPYLELFARRQRLGWDSWGNECLEHVEMDGAA